MAVLTSIIAEVLANSVITYVNSNTAMNVANSNANGSVFRVSVGGTALPQTFGSISVYPSVNVSVVAGIGGNVSDASIVSVVIPPNPATGAFAAELLVTQRANGKSGGATANAIWVGSSFDPSAFSSSPGANGVVNVTIGASNTQFLGVTAQVLGAANANLAIETCVIASV